MENYERKLKAIERRRWQLWGLAFLLIILFSVAISGLSYWASAIPTYFEKILNFGVIRFALVALSLAFCIYIVEKELIFRKLNNRLIGEKVKVEILDHEVKKIEALFNASKAVNSVLGLNEVLDIILRSARGFLKADAASIMLFNKLTGMLEVANSIGPDEETDAKTLQENNEEIATDVFKKAKPKMVNVKANKKIKNKSTTKSPVKSAICVPLKTRKEVLGVISINVTSDNAASYGEDEMKTLMIFAEQAAMAIENVRLFEETKKNEKNLLKLNEELKEKNLSLKKYIKDLKSANTELEKFNRLTVNRELAMIKLKEKVKKLESA